jgi:hypothetical protein
MESLERGLVLAKQVLSQLSYTPTAGTTINSKAFAANLKLPGLTLCHRVYKNCAEDAPHPMEI